MAAAEAAWIGLAGCNDLAAKEALPRKLVELKAELAGPSPTPVVKLLVERAAACWLQTSFADVAAAKSNGATIEQARFAAERQDRAQKRYLSALAALATTKRLLRAATATATAKGDAAPANARPVAEGAASSLAVVTGPGAASDSSSASRRAGSERPGRSA